MTGVIPTNENNIAKALSFGKDDNATSENVAARNAAIEEYLASSNNLIDFALNTYYRQSTIAYAALRDVAVQAVEVAINKYRYYAGEPRLTTFTVLLIRLHIDRLVNDGFLRSVNGPTVAEVVPADLTDETLANRVAGEWVKINPYLEVLSLVGWSTRG